MSSTPACSPVASPAGSPADLSAGLECDLLVIGSGAGGLSAAVTAAHLGLKVVVAEKEAVLGGTSAWSGGWMWVPHNPLARAAGIEEDPDAPRRYLRAILGAAFDEPAACTRLEAFLAHAPSMVQFHLNHTALRFVDGNAVPDFHGQADGARTGGRSVCAAPFDARQLGADGLALLRPPLGVLAWLGLSIGGDLRHFMRANRALDSAWYVAKRIARQLTDRLIHGQGTLRMGGNALVAALLASARAKGVVLLPRHAAVALLCEPQSGTPGSSAPAGQRVVGARLQTPQGEVVVRARCGVVCAAGGFAHELARKAALFPHAPSGAEHFSAAPTSNTGDGLRLAEAAGAWVDGTLADAGAWCPVSLVPQPGGGFCAFPHLAERGKPGLMAVDAQAQRFVSEAGNYHSFMRALFARHAAEPVRPGQPLHAWLVCDARFIRRYGLGFAKPWPFGNRALLANGYLKTGRTLAQLAAACGLDAAALQATVARYNQSAAQGVDAQFARGQTPYERMQGDAEHPGPNPCVAPLERAPFYAVKLLPGSLGTFAGLATNAHAQVLNAAGQPLAGLYAVGNDAASVMRGHYPSGGITLGPAMTFGYVLAHHAAGQPLPQPQPEPLPKPQA
jgi:succinate dehydrogenase/fumarate reductase flavoprotein subunit